MTTPAKGHRPEDLPAVHPGQARPMLRAAGRHRPTPRKPSVYNLLVAGLLVLISVTALEGWAAILISALGAVNALVFLIMHFRHAAYVVTTGAQKELEKR